MRKTARGQGGLFSRLLFNWLVLREAKVMLNAYWTATQSVTLHSISQIAFFSTVLAIELQGTRFVRKGLQHRAIVPAPKYLWPRLVKHFPLSPFPFAVLGREPRTLCMGGEYSSSHHRPCFPVHPSSFAPVQCSQ